MGYRSVISIMSAKSLNYKIWNDALNWNDSSNWTE